MIKKELLKMPKLKATPYMLRRAKMDKPKDNVSQYYHNKKYNHWLYLRCCVKKGILKASFFLTETMRYGGDKPVYDVFFDKKIKSTSRIAMRKKNGSQQVFVIFLGLLIGLMMRVFMCPKRPIKHEYSAKN